MRRALALVSRNSRSNTASWASDGGLDKPRAGAGLPLEWRKFKAMAMTCTTTRPQCRSGWAQPCFRTPFKKRPG